MLEGASVKKNSSIPARVNRSADPNNAYWMAIQKKVMGNGALESSMSCSVATCFLLTSTRAAAAMATMERTSPVPILCRWEMPVSLFVNFRANGMMTWSYTGASTMMMTIGNTGREAGGILRDPRLVSIEAACWTEKVESWAKQQLRMTVLAKMGKIFKTILTSSTCFIVHSRAEHTGFKFTALFRNLKLSVWVSKESCSDSSALFFTSLSFAGE
uniref:Uncharacterized protein n=1 Tax=Opuntia streptacantha TaxID=393608 RepID=A0A7C9CFE1_OPUST